jgi:hypothetical protein
MRKLLVIIVTLATLGFLAGEAWAGRIKISGTHTANEIRDKCAKADGAFTEGGGAFGCMTACAGSICTVDCNKDGQCTGSCPKCGRRELIRDLPVLEGADAVDRTLNDSVERPKRPYR